MGAIIEFKNNNFGYDNVNCFNDFNLEINEGDILTLIGTPGSGKTTLLKMLCNKLPNDSILYDGISIKDTSVETLKKELVVIFDTKFNTNTVEDELMFYLKKLNMDDAEAIERINEFKKTFNLDKFLHDEPQSLSYTRQTLIKILRYLIIKPRFIAIDNIFANLNRLDKKNIISYLKSNKMTLLNVVTNLDDALYGNKLCVLENFVLILEGTTTSVLKTDTLLTRLGFTLPLPVELSIELNNYNVLNGVYTDNKKLVNELWK